MLLLKTLARGLYVTIGYARRAPTSVRTVSISMSPAAGTRLKHSPRGRLERSRPIPGRAGGLVCLSARAASRSFPASIRWIR